MTTSSYYVCHDLTTEEATSRPPTGQPIPGYYVSAIRRRRRPGWVYRLHGDFPRYEALTIVANLNAPRGLEQAA